MPSKPLVMGGGGGRVGGFGLHPFCFMVRLFDPIFSLFLVSISRVPKTLLRECPLGIDYYTKQIWVKYFSDYLRHKAESRQDCSHIISLILGTLFFKCSLFLFLSV